MEFKQHVNKASYMVGLMQEEIIAEAVKIGLTAVFPLVGELLLDIDWPSFTTESKSDIGSTAYRTDKVIECLRLNEMAYGHSQLLTRSANGNWHIYIYIGKAMVASEAIILQTAMGSDPVREVLSLRRIQLGSDAPIALFETAESLTLIQAWREKRVVV